MKALRIVSVLSLACICLCSCKVNDNPVEGGDTVRVMSYNIRYGTADDGDNSWEIRKAATPEMLMNTVPDIFGVQEALQSQIKYITVNCPQYKSYGVGRDDGMTKGECMAIFYNTDKVSLVDCGTYWLSETPDTPSKGWDAACYRTATWALLEMKAGGKRFFYVNTHLDHKGVEARTKGLALIVRKIADMNPDNLPMILTGDFNVTPDDACLTDLDAAMFSARKAAEVTDNTRTYNAYKATGGSVIDYIYFSGFSKCKDFRVINETYAGKPYISDHYPIVSTLIF